MSSISSKEKFYRHQHSKLLHTSLGEYFFFNKYEPNKFIGCPHKLTHSKLLHSGLNEYYYNNQYGVSHFHNIDRYEETDYHGNSYFIYEYFIED